MTSTTMLLPAAQYLRMSTEHQQYSLQNQAAAIQRYAHEPPGTEYRAIRLSVVGNPSLI